MALKPCLACGAETSEESRFCPQCGISDPTEADRPAQPSSTPATRKESSGDGTVLAWMIAIAVGVVSFLIAGNFHVVSGTDGRTFIPRASFGFEDMFGAVSDCTSGPWIVAAAQHGKLCTALQEAGILESNEDREARIRRELDAEMQRAQGEIERQTQEILRGLR
jgi:hypothetical protein